MPSAEMVEKNRFIKPCVQEATLQHMERHFVQRNGKGINIRKPTRYVAGGIVSTSCVPRFITRTGNCTPHLGFLKSSVFLKRESPHCASLLTIPAPVRLVALYYTPPNIKRSLRELGSGLILQQDDFHRPGQHLAVHALSWP